MERERAALRELHKKIKDAENFFDFEMNTFYEINAGNTIIR